MPLFTDGLISTLEQLAAQDSAVLDIASTENIDVTAKLSLAQEEVGLELTAAASRSRFGFSPSAGWWPGCGLSSQLLQLNYVVVTPPLRLWHTFHTLALVYRDAYNNQLNDRYLGKWTEYKTLAKWATELLFQIGVGFVSDPIPVAQPPVVLVTSGSFQATTYFVQASWLNSRGEEGVASPVVSVIAPDQSTIQATIPGPPSNIKAWNIYAGRSVDFISLQAGCPLGLNEVWTLPPSGLSLGKGPARGQDPSFFRPISRYLQRG
ncbi:MAG TPA: hypothetical protein VJN43_04425 [Bryobacteraceae bacterium]|nr:hypothetical protein [Bryobacteraceae bacterium]